VDELAARSGGAIHLVPAEPSAEADAATVAWFLEHCHHRRAEARAAARALGVRECTLEKMAQSFADALLAKPRA